MREFRIESSSAETSAVLCGAGALKELSADFVFTDSNVFGLYEDTIKQYFPAVPVHVMPAGEEHKTPETLFALLGAMAKAGVRRTGRLVCFGGGVVGDIGGLASALYMRGIDCVQIPTTLLSQVDSSVGGKTAVDFCGVKNLVGAFKLPSLVIVDPRFLNTLPAREIRCGLGEIVKHAALNGALFDRLTENRDRLFDLSFLAEIVPDNIAVKAEVVKADARESGLRKCLNLGHTTGHAFELYDGKLSHGEYVLAGIVFEAELAKRYA
ncbi:MAG: 3-dehydroquinate synthase, partial [Clostridia bacterium]|nr:3-dehydroquinate synthase [Clostridia bacterium]